MGKCPCPRCLLPKEKIFEVGTKNDERRRIKLERNSEKEQYNIGLARKWIYDSGFRIKSAGVERLLSDQSLVPTLVSLPIIYISATDQILRMPFRNSQNLPLTFTRP